MQKAMDTSVHRFFKLLELLVVVCMVAMVIMVFGNVVLRYAFNSGISISDEMSRYCFIWLTYIGAMVAMREGGHLGVDTVVKHLPVMGKKVCLFLSEALMLFCNGLFFLGTWKMHELQVSNVSVVVGISMIWIYGIGYVVATVMGFINLNVLYRLLTGQIRDDELVQVIETEGLADVGKHMQGNRG
ncbi:TRAP transporter small permease [Polaromonas sp.]|uniref:TRAP transporter small permease n=1 Tax=Polaromonas sp. TaxID=1869339 RepID=UPI00356B1B0B